VTSRVLRKRGLFAMLAIAAMLLLGACDNQPAQPTPTATVPPAPIAQETPPASDALPTDTASPAEQPTAAMVETPTAPAQPTATNAQAADEPLTLSPVAIETNDATRVGAFSQERTLNLPPGFGVKVFATELLKAWSMRPSGVRAG
jgi:type IV secretory pathway VirB10-like protein